MKLLLVNPNTTAFVTGLALAEAQAATAAGVEVMGVTGVVGPPVIGTRFENALAEAEAIRLVATHGVDADGVLLAVSYDTGLAALRELLDVPVVGITEAALHTACFLGGRIGVISFGARVMPLYRELVERYGLASRVAGWRVLEASTVYAPGDTAAVDAELVAAAQDLASVDAAEVVVLIGTVMAGAPSRIQARVPVPVLEGVRCGIGQLELLVRLGMPPAASGSYATPRDRRVDGIDPAIQRLLDG